MTTAVGTTPSLLRPGPFNPMPSCGWLPDMDLNHDKQIQSLLCYRYTIGQSGQPGQPTRSPHTVKSRLPLA